MFFSLHDLTSWTMMKTRTEIPDEMDDDEEETGADKPINSAKDGDSEHQKSGSSESGSLS